MFSQMENFRIHLPIRNYLQRQITPNSITETVVKMAFLTKEKFSISVIIATRCASGTMVHCTHLKSRAMFGGSALPMLGEYVFLTKAAQLFVACLL